MKDFLQLQRIIHSFTSFLKTTNNDVSLSIIGQFVSFVIRQTSSWYAVCHQCWFKAWLYFEAFWLRLASTADTLRHGNRGLVCIYVQSLSRLRKAREQQVEVVVAMVGRSKLEKERSQTRHDMLRCDETRER